MKKTVLLLSSIVIGLTGCVEREILDDISLEVARAYDWIDGETVRGTTLVYNFQPDKTIENTTLSTTATTTRELVNSLQRKAPEPLSEGSIELFMFGKKLAKEGLIDYLDAPLRNGSIGSRLYLIVIDGEGEDFLKGEYGKRGNAIYIANLLDHNVEHENLPKTNLHLFFHDYYKLGKTGYLPILKKTSNKEAELTGVSLFGTDNIKEVDTVEVEKMFFFKLLVDKFHAGSYKVTLADGESVVRNISSTTKMKLTSRKPYEISVQIKIDGITREYTGSGPLSVNKINKIDATMEKAIKKECEELIKRFQAKKIDPAGFGFLIKTKTRGMDLSNWEESQEYQSLKVQVKPDVTILESGVIE